ncbi:hypothetical protein GGR56DRAFT_492980 [Xylariaceae sp. FL0804]|nr:hypothetical protein GGR56DRAFT_492980 [Xylariaceae sp. FL0804]
MSNPVVMDENHPLKASLPDGHLCDVANPGSIMSRPGSPSQLCLNGRTATAQRPGPNGSRVVKKKPMPNLGDNLLASLLGKKEAVNTSPTSPAPVLRPALKTSKENLSHGTSESIAMSTSDASYVISVQSGLLSPPSTKAPPKNQALNGSSKDDGNQSMLKSDDCARLHSSTSADRSTSGPSSGGYSSADDHHNVDEGIYNLVKCLMKPPTRKSRTASKKEFIQLLPDRAKAPLHLPSWNEQEPTKMKANMQRRIASQPFNYCLNLLGMGHIMYTFFQLGLLQLADAIHYARKHSYSEVLARLEEIAARPNEQLDMLEVSAQAFSRRGRDDKKLMDMLRKAHAELCRTYKDLPRRTPSPVLQPVSSAPQSALPAPQPAFPASQQAMPVPEQVLQAPEQILPIHYGPSQTLTAIVAPRPAIPVPRPMWPFHSGPPQTLTLEQERKARFHLKLEQQRQMDAALYSGPTEPIHIFIDMSNIVIGFGDTWKSNQGISPDVFVRWPTFNFNVLAKIMERGRTTAKKVLAGSVASKAYDQTNWPPHFVAAKQLGYTTNIFTRIPKDPNSTKGANQNRGRQRKPAKAANTLSAAYNTDGLTTSGDESTGSAIVMKHKPGTAEQGVDENLHLNMSTSILECPGKPATIVLATGDAAKAEFSKGFKDYAIDAMKWGWNVELLAWRLSVSSAWSDTAFLATYGSQFRIIWLDNFLEELNGDLPGSPA